MDVEHFCIVTYISLLTILTEPLGGKLPLVQFRLYFVAARLNPPESITVSVHSFEHYGNSKDRDRGKSCIRRTLRKVCGKRNRGRQQERSKNIYHDGGSLISTALFQFITKYSRS